MKLQDRVAVVTGGGSGIGRAIALRFAEEGARVVVNDLKKDAAEKTVAEIGGGRGRAIAADVADSAQVCAMFEEVGRLHGGRLDILVNNAGIAETVDTNRGAISEKGAARMAEMFAGEGIKTHWDIVQNMSDAAWRQMLSVHLDGTFYCTREALKLMSVRDAGGAMVNISSVAALMGLETAVHYSAAKGGILAFTRAVAREVGSRGIRVNAICPGFIDTPMTRPIPELARASVIHRTPLGRWGLPEEVAATALFLASDESSFFTGQWLSPNGGLFTG
ncbi:MAG: SDR family oxidoreductase [Candidatus Rokuibacteriota bacterium]